MSLTLNIQHLKLISGYVNLEDVPTPGASVSTSQVSGSIIQPYKGFVGGVLELDAATAAKLSNPAGNTLYEGQYQYVQFLAGSSASNAIGKMAFWNDRANYIVTPDVSATTVSQFAGVIVYTNTKGNYGFVQISGRATCLFGTVTKSVPAIGDLVVLNQTPASTFDVLADATSITSPILKTVVGVATVAPASATASLVDLRLIGRSVY